MEDLSKINFEINNDKIISMIDNIISFFKYLQTNGISIYKDDIQLFNRLKDEYLLIEGLTTSFSQLNMISFNTYLKSIDENTKKIKEKLIKNLDTGTT